MINTLRDKWQHGGFRKYFANTGWIFFGKMGSLILSFFTFAYITRYLGPEKLGNLNYAQSLVALASVFGSLGIDAVFYRDLVRHKENRNIIIGSAVALKLLLGAVTFIVTTFLALHHESEKVIIMMVGILAFSNILQPFSLPSFYFDANQKSKINAIGTTVINIILSIVKLLIIYFNKGIVFFAAVSVLETFLNGLYFTLTYSYFFNSFTKWKVNLLYIKDLLKESWPLFLASISSVVYGRIDQVMLKYFLDASAVGLYAVAVRIAEVWNFLPGLIIFSLFPAIVNAKITDDYMYKKRFGRLLIGITVLSIVIALGITLTTPFLISIIAGAEYLDATLALRIYLWGVVGAVVMNVLQQLLLNEGWTKITFYITISGALINVILNLWLIPTYGLIGASWSTLIAYWIMPLSLVFFKETRRRLYQIFIAQFKDKHA